MRGLNSNFILPIFWQTSATIQGFLRRRLLALVTIYRRCIPPLFLLNVSQKPVSFKAHFEFGELEKLSKEEAESFQDEQAREAATADSSAD